ncbi:hypothetical protein GGX14DRAFT_407898 [Mycena pura]|uniref:Uncharacterized protein n=1 Tax=Mycena pura TaxID=153505 RepID=A0AAD6XYB7_9AGAR|nr:hypothetical protein GGX14DRAFT_407898 [Mycena pura]
MAIDYVPHIDPDPFPCPDGGQGVSPTSMGKTITVMVIGAHCRVLGACQGLRDSDLGTPSDFPEREKKHSKPSAQAPDKLRCRLAASLPAAGIRPHPVEVFRERGPPYARRIPGRCSLICG